MVITKELIFNIIIYTPIIQRTMHKTIMSKLYALENILNEIRTFKHSLSLGERYFRMYKIEWKLNIWRLDQKLLRSEHY